MAYFKRNGLVLSGTTETSNVKYERPVNVKTVNVKYANSFSHRVKDEDQSSEKARVKSNLLTLDEKTMEAFIIRLIPAMERKIVQEMETVKQELNAKYESLIAKTYFTENDKIKDTVKQRCNPIAYTGTILSPYFTIAETEEAIPENPAANEQKTDIEQVGVENKKPLAAKQYEEEEEPEYKWVESQFIKSIEKHQEESNAYLFKEPLAYWNIDKVIKINWISTRFRCLLESIIKLSNYSKIDSHTLLSITDAFSRLTQSNAFRSLPDNYPYTELIKEIYIKLNRLVQKGSYSEQVKFSLSMQLKSRLISIRSELLPYFPAMKFSELDFAEKNSALDWNEKEEQEEKIKPKKDWEYGFEVWKRKRYGEAD